MRERRGERFFVDPAGCRACYRASRRLQKLHHSVLLLSLLPPLLLLFLLLFLRLSPPLPPPPPPPPPRPQPHSSGGANAMGGANGATASTTATATGATETGVTGNGSRRSDRACNFKNKTAGRQRHRSGSQSGMCARFRLLNPAPRFAR